MSIATAGTRPPGDGGAGLNRRTPDPWSGFQRLRDRISDAHGLTTHHRRRLWAGGGRIHVEVRGLHGEHAAELATTLRRELSRLDGVAWVRIFGPYRRVVVAGVDDTAPSVDDVVAEIARIEASYGLARAAFEGREPEHPGDRAPQQRQLFGLVADGVAVGAAAVGRVAQFTPIPVEALATVNVVDTVPRVRGLVERWLGPAATDVLMAASSATATGLSQGIFGLVVDGAERIGALGELRARERTWTIREPELCATPWSPDAGVQEPPPRETALPGGPVERAGDRLPLAGAVLGGVATAATRSPRRGTQLLLAGMPKAANAGREAFATQLGRTLAASGILVGDRGALRRLDRVDTVVLDARVLVTGQRVLDRPHTFTDDPEVEARLHALHDPFDPLGHHADGDWRLAPIDDLEVRRPRGAATRIRGLRRGATPVLGLSRGEELVAVAPLRAQADPSLSTVVAAARDGDLRLLVAGRCDPALDDRVHADGTIPGGTRAAPAVRALQREGRVVAAVAADHPQLLAAADVGIGIHRAGGPGCWAAGIVGGPDLDDAAFVLEAVPVAREISRRSAAVASAGSAAATALVFTGGAATAGRRALTAVNGAALVSMAGGALAGLELRRREAPPPDDQQPWHAMSSDDVLRTLGSSAEGLSSETAALRRRGQPDGEPPPGLLRAVAEELDTPLTPILGAAAGLSSLVGSVSDAVLVGSVLGVNAVVGGAQRVRTDQQVSGLRRTISTPIRVRRPGGEQTVTTGELVDGDVIRLRAGDPVPADCRVLAEAALEVDESSLTGESLPVRKQAAPTWSAAVADRRSMLYRDTTLAAGEVEAVVVATGAATESGRSLAIGNGPERPDGVEQRMAELTRRTVRWSLSGGALAATAGMLRTGSLRSTFGLGVNLAVAAVPEGLPILATAAQLSAARRLASHGTLVREPRTIEALGRVDVLAIDKTGTLTEGRIALHGVVVGTELEVLGGLGSPARAALAAAARACPEATDDQPLVHATDHAVVEGARTARVGHAHDAHGWRRVAELPFEPARGFHATLGRTDGGGLLSVKGAPELVFPRCVAVRTGDGVEVLDADARQRWTRRIGALAREGHRVLAVAERATEATAVAPEGLQDLELCGLLALSDPVRATAATAVDTVRRAGVDVVMITGDHPTTAESVAAELGILGGGAVLTGAELDQLDDAALDALLGEVSVYARVTPAHKVRIVAAMQRTGRVVAMTGDGANDAPAIRLADVGMALGVNGRTHAAREAADMVVTDDRVETIIDGIIVGRATWMAVRDALAILVGGNLGEIAYTVIGSTVSRAPPINARQLLLVNLLTDMAPATAIAMRPPRDASPEQLLREGPLSSLGGSLQRDITVRALASAGGATTAYVAGRLTGRPARANTIGLVALVGSQLGQTVVAGRSPAVTVTGLVSTAALAGIVQTPGLSQFFGCTPLGPVGWTIATASSGLATGAAVVLPRVLPPPRDPRRGSRRLDSDVDATARKERTMSTNTTAADSEAATRDRDAGTASTNGEESAGRKVGRAAGTALSETGFVTLGLGAYATDLVKSLRSTPEALRAVGNWTAQGMNVAGQQMARGYRLLSKRGHRVVGAPGREVLRPPEEAAAAGAAVAREAAGAMHETADVLHETADVGEQAAERLEPEPTEYEEMTLTQLRDLAREHDIPGRSGMNREELVDALRRTQPEDMTVEELREEARERDIAGRSGMNRDELVDAVEREREEEGERA